MALTSDERTKLIRILKATDVSRLLEDYFDAIEDGTQLDDGAITADKLAAGVGGASLDAVILSDGVDASSMAPTNADLDKCAKTFASVETGDVIEFEGFVNINGANGILVIPEIAGIVLNDTDARPAAPSADEPLYFRGFLTIRSKGTGADGSAIAHVFLGTENGTGFVKGESTVLDLTGAVTLKCLGQGVSHGDTWHAEQFFCRKTSTASGDRIA